MYMCTNPIRSLRTKAPRPYGASWRWRQPCGNCWLCLESLPASCMHGLMCGRSAARLTAELKVIALGRAYGRSYMVMMTCMYVGTLLSWGKGTHGQLGLGPSVTYCPYPSPIHFSFQRTIITQISTGDVSDNIAYLYCCMYVCMYLLYVCMYERVHFTSLQRHTLAIDNQGHLFSWWD